MATRHVSATTTTTVRHIAHPLGRSRENGPHLSDLREFVDACEGLPGELLVRISKGSLNESGRHDVTIETTLSEPTIERAS